MTFLQKEECKFYSYMKDTNHLQNLNTHTVIKESVKLISSNQIYFEIKHFNHNYKCNIFANKFGIFRILIDNLDKNRYKNKTNIGENLQSDLNLKYEVNNDSLILKINENDFDSDIFLNKNMGVFYKYFNNNIDDNMDKTIEFVMKIKYEGFLIEYFINGILIAEFNKNKTLHLPQINTHNSFDLTIFNSENVYGLPERLSEFSLKDDSYRLFNLDYFEQVPGDPQALYGSIPMLHSINKNDKIKKIKKEINSEYPNDILFTLFLNNTSQIWVDIKTTNKNKVINWTTEGGLIDLYLFSDFIFYRNFYKISLVTGFANLPPLFSLGYHQCRWGYLTQEDVMVVDEKMTDCNIPYDVMWLDIDHTDDKKYFTWDLINFPEIKEFLTILKARGRTLVTIIDPHMKAKKEYSISQILKENNCLVLKINDIGNKDLFVGYCWPGDSYYVDFINTEKLTEIYKSLFKNEEYFLNSDNIHTWIDMNEPSVFNSLEMTMPPNCLHYDGTEYVSHYEVHNIYGYTYHQVTYEALKNRYDDQIRPFVLSRSFYAGSQKFGFIWTGDNKATFQFLTNSIETLLTVNLCGISACGADVGGFDLNPTEELMKSWFELGVFYPFFRGHSQKDSIRREPWLFSIDTLNSIRNSIKLRYHLLIYFYTKFFEHTLTGIPLMKPMWLRFPNFYNYFNEHFITNEEENVISNKNMNKDFNNLKENIIRHEDVIETENSIIYDLKIEKKMINYPTKNSTTQFVYGDEFIISPYLENISHSLYLPNFESTHFYDFKNGNLINSKEKIIEMVERKELRMIVIPGSIIPWTEEVGLSSEFTIKNSISLKIFTDINQKATGTLYLDDGKSFDYKSGKFIYITIHYEKGELVINNKNENFNNNLINLPKWDKIYLFGVKDKVCKDSHLMIFDLSERNIKINELNKIKLF